MCREKGYFDLNNVAYAIFETSEKLSVMPKGNPYIVLKEIDKKLYGESDKFVADLKRDK